MVSCMSIAYCLPVVGSTTCLTLSVVGRTFVSPGSTMSTTKIARIAGHVTLLFSGQVMSARRSMTNIAKRALVADVLYVSQRCFVSPRYVHGTVQRQCLVAAK